MFVSAFSDIIIHVHVVVLSDMTSQDLVQLLQNVESEIKKCEDCLSEETQKFHKYKVSEVNTTCAR